MVDQSSEREHIADQNLFGSPAHKREVAAVAIANRLRPYETVLTVLALALCTVSAICIGVAFGGLL